MKKTLSFILVLLMVFSVVSAYAQSPAQEKDYSRLNVGTITPFDGKFFTGMWGNVASDIDVRALIHGYNLVEWNRNNGMFDIDPSVVSGIAVTENPQGDRTYTLSIYGDLFYSDGTPITAADYAFSMLLSCDPRIAAIGGNTRSLDFLLGYEDYMNATVPYLAGIRVYSDHTLAITVNHDYLPFFYELGLLDCNPYPISVIAPGCSVVDDGAGVYISGPLTAALLQETILNSETGYLSHPSVTSGPYKLVSYDGATASFEINARYKGNSRGAKPSIPNLIYKAVRMDEMIDLLSAGELDLVARATTASFVQDALQLAAQQGTLSRTSYPRNGLGFITFCCEQDTVSSVAVRQAISYCVDKELLVSETVGGFGQPVDGYYGLGQWMYQIIRGTQPYPVQEGSDNYDQALADWESLTLDQVKVYDLDVNAAIALLEQDGWTFNQSGTTFDPAVDAVRCKVINDKLVALDLRLICADESEKAESIEHAMKENLAKAGIRLTVEALPLSEVVASYYRNGQRDCDMIFMATNFDMVFDPSLAFMPDGADINVNNPSAINDDTLYGLAMDMRHTDAADMLGYVSKWISFQERFQQVVPMIPLYSSVYFDFYPQELINYNVMGTIGWSQAIVDAYLSDVPDEAASAE